MDPFKAAVALCIAFTMKLVSTFSVAGVSPGPVFPCQVKPLVDSEDDITESTSSLSSLSSGATSVTFGSVLIHYHPIVLSNNPAVREGPPIELSWRASYSELFHVDELAMDNKPTAGHVKRIVGEERERWLREKGFCEHCIRKVSQEIAAIKNSRDEEAATAKEYRKEQRATKEQNKEALDRYKVMSTASHRAFNRELRRSLQKTSNAGIVERVETMRQKQQNPMFHCFLRRKSTP